MMNNKPQLGDDSGHGPPVSMPETLQPTFRGFVRTSKDACLLLEMLLSGRLPHVPRRPHERERADIVKSGNVFIYEESISGVRRWTDGINWSPSRILGNFLIYREVKPGYPGEGGKKTAIKRKPKPSGGISKKQSPRTNGVTQFAANFAASQTSQSDPNNLELRDLYGSLVDSYPFVEDGLVKKTITVTVEGVPHHLVSYYKAADVLEGRLLTPSQDPMFAGIQVRESLIHNQTFRLPVEHEELKINENSEAFIPQERAHLAHQMFQQQSMYQQGLGMVQNDMGGHGLPNPGFHPDGLPQYGLSSAPMGMPYGQTSFQPHQNFRALPPPNPTPIDGMQALAQTTLDALNNGQFAQQNHAAFLPEGQESYLHDNMPGMPGMPNMPPNMPTMSTMPNMAGMTAMNGSFPTHSRHMSFPGASGNGYTSPPVQPTPNAFSPHAQPTPNNFSLYRQASITPDQHQHQQLLQHGYAAAQQSPLSPPSRDDHSPIHDYIMQQQQQHQHQQQHGIGGGLEESVLNSNLNTPNTNWNPAGYGGNNANPGQYLPDHQSAQWQ